MTIHTLYELVQYSVKSFASKVAFAMYGGEELSYAEVGTRVKHVQDLLIGAGLKAGDKVALLSSNMPNWCVSYLAVTSAGMVAVPILPDFSTEELEMIIAHSEAKALMVSDKLFAKLAKSTIESLHIVIRTKNLGVIASRPAAEKGAVGIPNPEDLAVIIYTSGTTSRPKGVMLSHANLCAQISMSAAIFPIFPDDTFLSVLPLAHTYECSIGMIYPFSMGARVVYLDRPPTASVLMPTLAEVRPSVMLIVPLIIEKIYRHQILAKFTSSGFWRALYKIDFMRRYLHRVVQNLVGNAVRYCDNKVRISGGVRADGKAYVCVEDDGPGIPEQERSRIFEAFARLDDSRTRASGGYGLGLSIVSRIAYWFGGEIQVDQSPNLGGARFVMTWPAKRYKQSGKNKI